MIAFKMAQALEAAGYSVELATDGEECLRRAKELPPDLVVLDIMMPKMHGIEVLKSLRDEHRTVRTGVIVCTAKDFKTEHAEAARLGVFDFLTKPFEPEALVTKVDAWFSRSGGYLGSPEYSAPAVAETVASKTYSPVLDTARLHFTV